VTAPKNSSAGRRPNAAMLADIISGNVCVGASISAGTPSA
jgi:hypothetical protein